MIFKKIRAKIKLFKECVSFVVMEVKWKDRSKYGYWDETATMHKPADMSALHNLYIYPYARVQPGLRLISYTGKLIVKKFSVCSANVLAITGNHVPTVGIPQFFLGTLHINDKEKDIVIGEGAWVGAHATLLSGAVIGRGAVIGASSLVNKEIPPYAVAVGSPAKIIATTFTLDQVLEHERKVFPEEERLSEKYLRNLFETHYEGLKSIGTDVICLSDEAAASQVAKMLSKMNK
jgi:acetyltransferase-like isoleucine patch superfamily enzyme